MREEKIEGMRVDVVGLLIPFKTRGDLVYGFVHTANPLHVMRIGEASNPGPARDWHDVGGVYYGRFDGELRLGISVQTLPIRAGQTKVGHWILGIFRRQLGRVLLTLVFWISREAREEPKGRPRRPNSEARELTKRKKRKC